MRNYSKPQAPPSPTMIDLLVRLDGVGRGMRLVQDNSARGLSPQAAPIVLNGTELVHWHTVMALCRRGLLRPETQGENTVYKLTSRGRELARAHAPRT